MSIAAHFAPRHLRDTTSWTDARARSDVVCHARARVTLPTRLAATSSRAKSSRRKIWNSAGAFRAATFFTRESTLDQTWIARPFLGWGEYRTPITGLYLASAGTHPGGGLTGLPGWLAGADGDERPEEAQDLSGGLEAYRTTGMKSID